MTCDILIFAPHPDDAEIHCGASIAKHSKQGARIVIVDATRGELGSRGNPEERAAEAAAAGEILGISKRENLDFGDGLIQRDNIQQRNQIVDCIRRHRPKLILSISPRAHHPDHRALGDLVCDAIKACELHKLPDQSEPAIHHQRLLCYEAEIPADSSPLLVPCSEDDWKLKQAAIACYGSQIYQANKQGPKTSISRKAFQEWVDARGKTWGYAVEAPYAEAFSIPLHPLAVNDLLNLWPHSDLA